jgi:lipoate-protein ligase A
MAIDEALLRSVQGGAAPVLRLYRWSPACLSFGRNQTARTLYDPDRIDCAGFDVVRRPTGGLAVLHDRELTYSIAAPAALLGGPRRAYTTINRALVQGLRGIGVNAEIATLATSARPDAVHPCFEVPAAGEVLAGGSKLVGSAQRCERRTLLQHGSILLDGDQAAIVACLFSPLQTEHAAGPPTARATTTAGTTLRSLLGRVPDMPDLLQSLIAGFEAVLGTPLAPACLSHEERTTAVRLQQQYDSDAWTWRR